MRGIPWGRWWGRVILYLHGLNSFCVGCCWRQLLQGRFALSSGASAGFPTLQPGYSCCVNLRRFRATEPGITASLSSQRRGRSGRHVRTRRHSLCWAMLRLVNRMTATPAQIKAPEAGLHAPGMEHGAGALSRRRERRSAHLPAHLSLMPDDGAQLLHGAWARAGPSGVGPLQPGSLRAGGWTATACCQRHPSSGAWGWKSCGPGGLLPGRTRPKIGRCSACACRMLNMG